MTRRVDALWAVTPDQAAPYLETAEREAVFQLSVLRFLGVEWPPPPPPPPLREVTPGGPCGGRKMAGCRAEWGSALANQCANCGG